MLSSDLASLYEVAPKVLLQSVRRNIDRFPPDFMFQLTTDEWSSLRSQIVTLENSGKGRHSKYLPFAFTQEGIAMLSSVLNSPRAIQVNIAIMRTFVKLRELMISHSDLAQKIETLEKKYNAQFRVVFNSIRELINARPKELVCPNGHSYSTRIGTKLLRPFWAGMICYPLQETFLAQSRYNMGYDTKYRIKNQSH